MQIVWLVNWNSNNADFQFQTAPTSFINQGVISGLAVTLNQVSVGSALISVTSNGQTWLITFHNTSLVTIDTSGTKKVWIEVTQAKIDNGVSNNEDGTGIAFINTGASYPWSGSYIPLASIASGVITDDRVFISMKAIKRKAMTANRLLYIDASGNEQELPYGTSGQVLTAVNGTTTPIWASPSVDINWLTEKQAFEAWDFVVVYDVWSSTNKKQKISRLFSSFWDGSDWDVIISTDTTIVRDMYYRDLTINSTKVLNPNGYKIYVSGTLTNNGIIRRNWNSWANGSWANGGAGGAALNQWSLNADLWWWNGGQWGIIAWVGIAGTSANPSYTIINGATGWTSWSFWAQHLWWVGWTSTRWALYNIAYSAYQTILWYSNPASFTWLLSWQYRWASSSGWWWADTTGAGIWNGWWGAGGNWWVIFIVANIFNNPWTIEAIGWTGWNGASPNWWGGGGWQGWVFYLIYSTLTALGTVTLTWWTAGTWWTWAQAGNTGVTIQINLIV